jgi:ATP-dependent RNA helicase DeaD
VVGAIANESGIEGVHIGRVDIREDHSFVDLPEGMPKQIFKLLQKVLVAGRELRISAVSEKPPKPPKPVKAPTATLRVAPREGGSREGAHRPALRQATTRPVRKRLGRPAGPSRGRKD